MYSSTLSLTSAVDGIGGQSHALAPLPHKRPDNHGIGSWEDHRAGVDRGG